MDDRGHDVHGHVFQQVKIETPCWPGYPLLHATRPIEPFPGKGRDVRARSMDWICGFPRGAFTRGNLTSALSRKQLPQSGDLDRLPEKNSTAGQLTCKRGRLDVARGCSSSSAEKCCCINAVLELVHLRPAPRASSCFRLSKFPGSLTTVSRAFQGRSLSSGWMS